MKILLDVKALERMIAGDSTVEVEIRNGIVQEFAKRHLKVIANSEEFRKMVSVHMDIVRLSVEQEMSDLFLNVKKDSWGHVVKHSFKEDIKKKICEEAYLVIEREIAKQVTGMVERRLADYSATANAYVDSLLARYTKQTLDEMVEEKFRKAIAKT
jgi:hypothetical protein